MDMDTIKNNIEFKRVYRSGKSIVGAYMVLYVKKAKIEDAKYGITVSKKIGNAVYRNKARRLIKESIRLNKNIFLNGYIYVFVARVRINRANYFDVEKNLIYLISKFKKEMT